MVFVLLALGIGLLLGWVLFTSRICFASNFIQFIYLNDRTGLRRLAIVLLISFIAMSLLYGIYFKLDVPITDGRWKVGIPTIIGAFLFGIGMTLAGGCTISTLIRIGEGAKIYLLVALGIVVGYNMGNDHYTYWWKQTITFTEEPLWHFLPWWAYLTLQLILLGLMYGFSRRKNKWK